MNPSFQRRSVLVGMLGSALPALAQKNYDPGATDSEIKLGMSMPLSGPASTYSLAGKVVDAYFRRLNEGGGINGRKINIVMLDDQYAPPKAVEVARRLVEQEQVLALVGGLGTPTNAATQRYLNLKKVPQLFILSGIEKFNDPKNSPWTIPLMPSNLGEGRVIAQSILATSPGARIAVLLQNDDLGKEILRGLRAGLGEQAAKMIVAEATYEVSDPTVDSQIVKLKSAGADTLVMLGSARSVAQAIRKTYDLDWKPSQYVNFGAASIKLTFTPAGLEKSAGILTLAVYKDPSQPRWAADPEVLAYQSLIRKYLPAEDPMVGVGVGGYLVAQALEHVLRKAGNNLTRENIRQLSSQLDGFRAQMLLPGMSMGNSPQNLHVIHAYQLVRFNGRELDPVGTPMRVD